MQGTILDWIIPKLHPNLRPSWTHTENRLYLN